MLKQLQQTFIATLSATALLVASSCADPAGENSSIKITNGFKKQPKQFKAVVTQGNCSAVFVSPTVLISAAHCHPEIFGVGDVKPTSAASMGEILGQKWYYSNDIRIVVFPKPVSTDWMPISSSPLAKGDLVVLAGYGVYDYKNNKADGQFRYGIAEIDDFELDNHIAITYGNGLDKTAISDSLDSALAPGDSGGPMLRDGLLVGIASAISDQGNNRIKSIHVNLMNPEIKAFLLSQIKAGIDIRMDEKPTQSYEECFQVEANKEANRFEFEVPHRSVSSVSGAWSTCTCADCALTDGRGYLTGAYSELRPKYSNIAGGALIVGTKMTSNPNDHLLEKAGPWTGSPIFLKTHAFGSTMQIHDSGNFEDNKGSLTVCFL